MKLIVFADGSMEETIWADEWLERGLARYATDEEVKSYERLFREDDERMDQIDQS